MNRIDAHGLKFHDEASGRFHCVVRVRCNGENQCCVGRDDAFFLFGR
jgi:hypothetical protein